MKIERCGDYWLAVERGPLRKIIVEGDAPADVAFGVAAILKQQKKARPPTQSLPSHMHVHGMHGYQVEHIPKLGNVDLMAVSASVANQLFGVQL